MNLTTGTRLGPYQILAPIGAGGMGEVYRARDTRLGRDVAVKVLPAEFATDLERLRRFEQEARAVAALNHPNILVLYDIGSSSVSLRGAGSPEAISSHTPGLPRPQGGLAVTEEPGEPVHYIVTEMLDGESLRERLRGGPMAPAKAVDFGVQIVQGLAAAHEKGIVHRDLKPENLFVTKDGRIKILDFGLARLRPQGLLEKEPQTEAPTVDSPTREGMVLGTVGYMSPEQARGQSCDHRTDIFAFGAVLYEMTSGERAFAGTTPTDVVAAILKEDPPPLPRNVPPALDRIVRQCLEKRPEDRFSSAHDLALALQASGSDEVGTGPSVAPVPGRSATKRVAWIGGMVLLLAVAAASVVWLRGGRSAGAPQVGLDPRKVMVGEFENMTGDPSLDPVGSMVAAAVSQGLVELGDVEVVAAPGSELSAKRKDEVALRAAAKASGAGTLVSGSVYLNGGNLDLRGRVSDVASGKLLFALKPEVGPLNAPGEAVDRVRQRVMGAMLLRSGATPSLGGITTPPLYSAYQEYIAGVQFMGVDSKAVLSHLERAAAIDPEFWHPQIRLLMFYRASGNTTKYEAMQKRLKEDQDKLGPADRILVQYYDALFDGRTLEAYRKAREMLALAPHDFTFMFAAANLAKNLNRPHEALECLGDIEKIDWKTFGHWMQGTWVLGVAAFAHHLLGEYEAELKVAEFGVHLYPDMLNVRQDKVRALAALGRVADVDRTITESLGVRSRTQVPGDVMLTAAEELRAHGHAEDARRIAARCAEWYGALTGEEAARRNVPLNRIECLWLTESWPEAEDLALALVKRTPSDPYAIGYRGILAARAGDRATADAMDKALAENTEGRMAGGVYWARACIAAQRGERDRAMTLLREGLGHGFTNLNSLHVYVFLEPLHGYPPYEELLKPKG